MTLIVYFFFACFIQLNQDKSVEPSFLPFVPVFIRHPVVVSLLSRGGGEVAESPTQIPFLDVRVQELCSASLFPFRLPKAPGIKLCVCERVCVSSAFTVTLDCVRALCV